MELKEDVFKALHTKFTELKESSKKSSHNENCWDMSMIKNRCMSVINDIDSYMAKIQAESPCWFRLLSMKSVVFNFQVDLLLLFENLTLAMEILIENCQKIHPYAKNSYVAYIYMQTIQKIASICKIKDDLSSAQEILETSMDIYESSKNVELFDTEELFSSEKSINPSPELSVQFDKTYIFILEILRTVHDSKNDTLSSIVTQHHILNIQLKIGDESLFLWLQNLIKLSNQLIVSQFYGCARHHLSVATYKLDSLKKLLKEDENSREHAVIILEGLEANLALVWIKYGLTLFLSSKKKHLQLSSLKQNISESLNDEKETFNSDETEKKTFAECRTMDKPIFIGKTDPRIDALVFNVDVTHIESLVASEIVETNNQAKDLFEFALKWFTKAGDYYEFKDFPTAYISLMLDLSELHKCFAFFEPNPSERYTLYQKRQTVLNILKNISVQLDTGIFVDTHVEITRELAQVHLDLLNSDLDKLKEIKEIALNRLQLNYTQSSHLEKQLSKNVEILEAQLNSGMFQNHTAPRITLYRK